MPVTAPRSPRAFPCGRSRTWSPRTRTRLPRDLRSGRQDGDPPTLYWSGRSTASTTRRLRDARRSVPILRCSSAAVLLHRQDARRRRRADAAGEAVAPGARSALISDYVPECATARLERRDVRKRPRHDHRRLRPSRASRPTRTQRHRPFFRAERHADKIAFACGHYHAKPSPARSGSTTPRDSYVLGAAIAGLSFEGACSRRGLLRRAAGGPIWPPLGLSPVLLSTPADPRCGAPAVRRLWADLPPR